MPGLDSVVVCSTLYPLCVCVRLWLGLDFAVLCSILKRFSFLVFLALYVRIKLINSRGFTM